MTSSKNSQTLVFEAPGPGTWEQDPVHFPRSATRYLEEIGPASIKKGSLDSARYYGLLSDGFEVGFVNGFGYIRKLPPTPAEIPARFERAEQVFQKNRMTA